MYCTKCGTSNPDRAVFCSRCGQRMPTAAPVTPVAAPPPPPPVTPVTPQSIPTSSIPLSAGQPPSQSAESWIDPTPPQPRPAGNVFQPGTPVVQPLSVAQFPGVFPPPAQPPYAPPMAQPPVAQTPVAQSVRPTSSDSWVQFSQPAPGMPPQAAPPQPPPQPPTYAQPVYGQQPAYGQPYPPQSVPMGYPPQELRGIGGWLMFLVLCLTIFGPIASLFFIILLLAAVGESGPSHPEFINFARVLIVTILAYTIWGIVVGTKLWKIRPGAINLTKQYVLFGSIAFSIISNFLPIFLLPPSDQSAAAMPTAVVGAAVGVAISIAWYAYLKSSRRVKNTFPMG